MDGRVPTFAFNVAGHSAREAATALGERDIAVWQGNYYAVETMKRLGLEDGGSRPRRHRPLQHGRRGRPAARRARRAAVRLLVLGGTKFLGRALADAALARGHELTLFNRGETNPGCSRRPSSCTATATAASARSRAGSGTP